MSEREARLLSALKRILDLYEGVGETTSPARIEARAAIEEAEAAAKALKVSR
jgi:hypothetical protein